MGHHREERGPGVHHKHRKLHGKIGPLKMLVTWENQPISTLLQVGSKSLVEKQGLQLSD